MTSLLHIHRVKILPLILEARSIYLVKPDDSQMVTIYVPDAAGQASFRALGDENLEQQILAVIVNLLNEPNGIAGLTELRFLDPSIRFDGQDTPILGSNEEYLWRAEHIDFVPRSTSGGNYPSYGAVIGNIQGLRFHQSTMNQVMCNFHVNHDIALGTKIYPFINWMPLSNQSGAVRWGIEYTVAKGQRQQAFHNPVTVYITTVIPTNSNNVHMVSEVSELDAIPSTNIEPGSVIKMRVFRDASSPTDSYPTNVHSWGMGMRYQFARLGTKNKAPNFYG